MCHSVCRRNGHIPHFHFTHHRRTTSTGLLLPRPQQFVSYLQGASFYSTIHGNDNNQFVLLCFWNDIVSLTTKRKPHRSYSSLLCKHVYNTRIVESRPSFDRSCSRPAAWQHRIARSDETIVARERIEPGHTRIVPLEPS